MTYLKIYLLAHPVYPGRIAFVYNRHLYHSQYRCQARLHQSYQFLIGRILPGKSRVCSLVVKYDNWHCMYIDVLLRISKVKNENWYSQQLVCFIISVWLNQYVFPSSVQFPYLTCRRLQKERTDGQEATFVSVLMES